MADPFVAEIRIFGFNFAPKGWALCDGQLLPISQNTALFSLLGTQYGGDGKSNFALPDLQGRTPIDQGQGPGVADRSPGESGGEEQVTLVASQMPVHTHVQPNASTDSETTNRPGGAVAAGGGAYARAADTDTTWAPLAPVGGDQPHPNMQPYLVSRFCIALLGVYPARS